MEGRSCGALRSPEDPDDCIFERLAQGPTGYYLSEFPDEFDLREFAQPVRDQVNRGTCAAFVAATIKEIQENKESGFNEWMSPEFIYHHRENKPASGMYGRNVFQILQLVGSVPEVDYPYAHDESTPDPDPVLYMTASRYRIAGFAKVTTVDGLKRALLELGPAYIQTPLYTTRPHFWRGVGDEKWVGGHALTAIGFNKEGFILQNSWGRDWNGDGCIVLPYEEWGSVWECWVGVDENNTNPSETVSSRYGDLVERKIASVTPESQRRRRASTRCTIM